MDPVFYQHAGYCLVCEQATSFIATSPNFRSSLKCEHCAAPPRQRALMLALDTFIPGWRELSVHESSPATDALGRKFVSECPGYVVSQYREDLPFGIEVEDARSPGGRFRNIDLSRQDFDDGIFHLVIAQDVFEHLFDPAAATREISRTLGAGGYFVATVPMVQKNYPSRRRASIDSGEIHHILPELYHGNPVNAQGVLVTIDWGYDLVSFFARHSKMETFLFCPVSDQYGILGDFNEILIARKSVSPDV